MRGVLPAALLPISAAAAVAAEPSGREVRCLALVAYAEAAVDGPAGMAAVIRVVRNRMADPRFPDDACAVIAQVAQFQPIQRSDVLRKVARDPEGYSLPRVLGLRSAGARQALAQAHRLARAPAVGADPTGGALHFVNPDLMDPGLCPWFAALRRTARIGGHVFLTDRGADQPPGPPALDCAKAGAGRAEAVPAGQGAAPRSSAGGSPMRRLRPLAVLLPLLALPAPPAGAQERPAPAKESGVLRLLPPEPATSRRELVLGERRLAYTATAGTLPLRDGTGETTAELFHVAYALEPADPARPVTFVFNGGPGAASAFLNLGALGPRRVALAADGGYLPPPARLADNAESWLPFTDLVFVDPVGTGYSRAAAGDGDEAARRFYGVRQDASAMAAFVRLWLARAGRTLSPLFLVGESYGGFRAALLARALPEEAGLSPSGIVLVSPALEFALLRGGEGDALLVPWAVTLPSLAAVNLERRGGLDEAGLARRLDEAERYALGDYLLALAKGAAGVTPELERTLEGLTGLPPAAVRAARGRISATRFVREYARERGRVLSRYDGLVDGPDPEPSSARPEDPDPVLDRAVPVWTSAFVAYVRDELGYRTDVSYRLLASEVGGRWDYGTTPQHQGYAGALDALQAGRALNPALEVLVAHGRTDLVTPYLGSRYLLAQLPPLAGAAPVAERVFRGGHMFYMAEAARRGLKEEAERLYGRALRR